MKFKIKHITPLFLLSLSSAFASNIIGYEYWFDNAIGDKVEQVVSPAEQVTISEQLSTSALVTGVHSINVRFVDDSARWSSVNSSLFIKRSVSVTAGANTIEKCYWWYDNDVANKQAFTISSSEVISINELISTAALPSGIHSFNCYFQDANGVSSSVSSYLFIKRAVNPIVGSNKIERCEYWFDADANNRTEISLSANEIVSINELIDASTLATGIHSLNIRYQDTKGVWSSVTSSLFKKMSLRAFGATPNIVACEYWFDSNHAASQQITISSDTIVEANELISVTLPTGIHSFHIRFQDANGVWSSVSSSLIRKMAVMSSNPNQLDAYRYWFDDAIDSATTVSLASPVSPLDLTTEIDMSAYTVAEHLFHMQFRDIRGQWSSITTDSISRESFLKSEFSIANTPACDTVKVSFTNLSKDADSLIWSFGDGVISYESNPTHTYTNTGNYTVQLIARDTILHVDSVLSMEVPITVYTSPSIDLGANHTICNYDSVQIGVNNNYQNYIWNGVAGDSAIYAKSGTHILQVIDAHGCKATDTVVVEFYTEPTAPVAIFQGDSLSTKNSSLDLQWYKDDTAIPSAIDSVYKPSIDGDYHVTVSSTEGCYEISSNIINVVLSAIMEVGIANIDLYPNPAVKEIHYSHNLMGEWSLHIYDIQGRRLYNRTQKASSGTVNVSDLQNGVYIFVIEQKGQVKYMQRFIKK